MPDLNSISTLLQAVASLAWPTFAFVALVAFRKEIRSLLTRVKKGKLLGQELELGELQGLEAKATVALAQLPAVPSSDGESTIAPTDEIREKVLREASSSPKLGLLLLQSEIERETRELLASMGLLKRRTYPLAQMIRDLREQVPATLVRSVEAFLQVRNKIVHGRSASDEDVLSAIDSGFTILAAIRAVPHERHIVVHPGAEVYSDKDGNKLVAGVKAVVLEARSSGGAKVRKAAYPTTQDHFQKGKPVAWEWNADKTFGESWYRDPDSKNVLYGWTESMEFVGRPLDRL